MAEAAEKMPQTAAEKPVAPRAAREWEPLDILRRQMDRVFEDFGRGFGVDGPFGTSFSTMWPSIVPETQGTKTPAVDLVETDKAWEVAVELPGIAPDDVDVTLADGILTITGEKKEEREETQADYHIAERRFGAFRRAFRLPDGVDEDAIAATVANGVLTVTLPKTATAEKTEKKIAITPKEA